MEAPTIEQLRAKSIDQLIKEHDALTSKVVVGVQYYIDEIARREQAKHTEAMLAYTKQMRTLTIVITFATILNVAVTAIILLK